MTNTPLDQQWNAFNPPVSLLQDVSSTNDWSATNPGLVVRNSAVPKMHTQNISIIIMQK
jgi:hypothetical protein